MSLESSRIIIVHGCGAHKYLNEARALGVAEFLKQTPTRVDTIIFSGGATQKMGGKTEAEELARTFQDQQVSGNFNVILEEKSCDTRMSAQNCCEILFKIFPRYIGGIILASQEFHLRRIGLLYNEAGIPYERQFLLDTDTYIPEDMKDTMRKLLSYKRLKLQEPVSYFFDRGGFWKLKRTITQRRLPKETSERK